MGLHITTNLPSIAAQRTLGSSRGNIHKNMRQMASGTRITRAGDDAAGLAISERFRGQISSTVQAKRNATDGMSIVQTAEGSLNEISSMIGRMRELSIQASSDAISDVERGFIDEEVQGLKIEVERIAQNTKYRDQHLLNGSSMTYEMQVGVHNNEGEDRINFDAAKNNATLGSLGLDGVGTRQNSNARSSLAALDTALDRVGRMRSSLGGLQNRLTSTIDNLSVAETNRREADSQIRDTDVAMATSEIARNQIALEANTATLAQANQIPNAVLQLI